MALKGQDKVTVILLVLFGDVELSPQLGGETLHGEQEAFQSNPLENVITERTGLRVRDPERNTLNPTCSAARHIPENVTLKRNMSRRYWYTVTLNSAAAKPLSPTFRPGVFIRGGWLTRPPEQILELITQWRNAGEGSTRPSLANGKRKS